MLQGYEFAHEAMQISRLTKLMPNMMDTEVTPIITGKSRESDLGEYKHAASNDRQPAIRDRWAVRHGRDRLGSRNCFAVDN